MKYKEVQYSTSYSYKPSTCRYLDMRLLVILNVYCATLEHRRTDPKNP
jgi:hypothetical protein